MEFINTQKKSKTITQLIFEFIEKIFELSTHEFRGGFWIKKDKGNWVEEIYVPDSRKVYCQAVETFNAFLKPHFDKKTKDKIKEIEDKQQTNLEDYNKKKEEYENFIVKKLVLMKQVFELLMFLLKQKDYLHGTSYTETGAKEGNEESYTT